MTTLVCKLATKSRRSNPSWMNSSSCSYHGNILTSRGNTKVDKDIMGILEIYHENQTTIPVKNSLDRASLSLQLSLLLSFH